MASRLCGGFVPLLPAWGSSGPRAKRCHPSWPAIRRTATWSWSSRISRSWIVAYVPSADSLRVGDEGGGFAWVGLNPRTAAVLKRAVRNLSGFPSARLRVEPPQAQVDEVFTPAAQTAATRDRIDSVTTPWGWIAAGALAAALVLVTVARTLRRRRHVEVAPTKS
jgi:hypothetical protein